MEKNINKKIQTYIDEFKGELKTHFIKICDDVTVGAHTLITKNIIQSGNYVGIMPAQEHDNWAKSSVFIKKLSK